MIERIDPRQLAEWRALAKAATPGDWRVVKNRYGTVNVVCDYLVDGMSENVAVFIAASRAAVPALLAEVARLEAELDDSQSHDMLAQVARTEAAEAQVAALTRERDEARAYANSANYLRLSGVIAEAELDRDAALARESKLGNFCRMLVIDGAVREMSVLIDAARAALNGE